MIRRQLLAQIAQQLGELLAELVERRVVAVALQREDRDRVVRPVGASDAEIDATGEEAAEHAEHLGDLERAVVRQHHATASDANLRCRLGDRADQRLRTRAGEHRAAVVLGNPVAVIAEPVGQAGEIERVAQRLRAG